MSLIECMQVVNHAASCFKIVAIKLYLSISVIAK